MARPATGKTPLRNVRVPDAIWDAAKEKATAEGRTLSEVVVAYLTRYGSTSRRTPPTGKDESA